MHRKHWIPSLAPLLVALLGTACPARSREPKPAEAQVRVRVKDAIGRPVAGALFRAGPEPAAVTGPDGAAEIRVTGVAGEVRRLEVACPEGMLARQGREAAWVLEPAGPDALPRAHEAVCVSQRFDLPLVVRTRNAGRIPVLLAGQEVARTDPDGAAQCLVTARPGETLTVVLDTSADPGLRPRSPTHTFTAAGPTEVWIVDQGFDRPEPRARKRPARPKRPSRL